MVHQVRKGVCLEKNIDSERKISRLKNRGGCKGYKESMVFLVHGKARDLLSGSFMDCSGRSYLVGTFCGVLMIMPRILSNIGISIQNLHV